MTKSCINLRFDIRPHIIFDNLKLSVYMDSLNTEIKADQPNYISPGQHLFFLFGEGNAPLYVNVKPGETLNLRVGHFLDAPEYKKIRNTFNSIVAPYFYIEIDKGKETHLPQFKDIKIKMNTKAKKQTYPVPADNP